MYRLLLLGIFLLFELSANAEDNQLTVQEHQSGWALLFNGKTLDGWMTSNGKTSKRAIEDGAINPHRCGHYMMVHEKKWSDFILKLDFKISRGCNSGIFFRTYSLQPLPGKDVGFNGLEIAIDDTTTSGYHDTGALYDLAKPKRNAMRPAGQWNQLELTSHQSLITVKINGETVNRIDLNLFETKNQRPDGTSHKFDIAYRDHPRTGYIGLQDHGGDCWFKNIKLLEVSE